MSIQKIIEPFNKLRYIYQITDINSKIKEIDLDINIENHETYFYLLFELFSLVEFKLKDVEKSIFDMF